MEAHEKAENFEQSGRQYLVYNIATTLLSNRYEICARVEVLQQKSQPGESGAQKESEV